MQKKTNRIEMFVFLFNGRPDGIGNRIEQLLHIEKYCEATNKKCVYKWNNNRRYRRYPIYIRFKHIEIKETLSESDKTLPVYNRFSIKTFRTKLNYNLENHEFLFSLDLEDYDTAIHIRGGDRLRKNPTDCNYSTIDELESCIIKTAKYVNETESIKKCIIVCEETKYISKIKELINKEIYILPHDKKYHDWQDFYYLTRATQNVIMCCKFSTFSICASLLSNLNLITLFDSSKSSLRKFNAKIVKI